MSTDIQIYDIKSRSDESTSELIKTCINASIKKIGATIDKDSPIYKKRMIL